jgi:hypothetical protein
MTAHKPSISQYNKGCRCDECRTISTQKAAARKWRRILRTVAGENGKPYAVHAPRHGTLSTYTNWGCRCDPCRVANRVKCSLYNEKRRAGATRP